MLHIIANTNFFLTAFVMERLQDCDGVRVIAHGHRKRGLRNSTSKLIESSLPWAGVRSLFYPDSFLSALHEIRPQDAVLIFGVENIKELRILRRHIRAGRQTIFTWNPVRDYQQKPWLRLLHIRALKNLGMEVVTFDPLDAQQHGLRLVDQVYRDISPWVQTDVVQDIDLYFVGQDKGRLPVLQQIRASAMQAGLSVHFHVTPDKHTRYTVEERSLLANKPLAYPDNLALINRSRCLVEVVQPNQSGQTIRSLEAAFFDRKLLTTRLRANEESLYAADRVMVGAGQVPDLLRRFVRTGHVPVDREALKRHDMRYWWRQFDS